MIKILRRGAIENPWFYKVIMGGIAVAFAVSMGWWGFDNPQGNAIARVNDETVSPEEYQRAYRNASDIYRQLFKEKYDDQALRKQVVEELVQKQLWLMEAKRLHLRVTDADLKESLSKIGSFQKDGVFSAAQYHRVLRNNRVTPQAFERQQREQMLIEKARNIAEDGVALNATEIEDAKKKSPDNPDPDRAIADALYAKKQRALAAYGAALKMQADVQIREERL